MSLEQLLSDLRSSAATEREKGDKFERLMLALFRTEPTYLSQFSKVWLCRDWP